MNPPLQTDPNYKTPTSRKAKATPPLGDAPPPPAKKAKKGAAAPPPSDEEEEGDNEEGVIEGASDHDSDGDLGVPLDLKPQFEAAMKASLEEHDKAVVEVAEAAAEAEVEALHKTSAELAAEGQALYDKLVAKTERAKKTWEEAPNDTDVKFSSKNALKLRYERLKEQLAQAEELNMRAMEAAAEEGEGQ